MTLFNKHKIDIYTLVWARPLALPLVSFRGSCFSAHPWRAGVKSLFPPYTVIYPCSLLSRHHGIQCCRLHAGHGNPYPKCRMFSCCLIQQLFDSLQPHELWPARLLCPWDSPGKNIGMGYSVFFQGVFLTQRLNPSLWHCRWILYHLSHQGSLSVLGHVISSAWRALPQLIITHLQDWI